MPIHNQLTTQSALIITLAYSNQFEFPLSATEVFQRLIRSTGINPTLTSTRLDLQRLVELGLVQSANGYYWLSGLALSASTRIDRNRQTQAYNPKIASLVKHIKWIPWIRMVGITGSVAAGNTQPKDDIDLLIVCDHHRIWLVRLIMTIMSWLVGTRRSWRADTRPTAADAGKWCLNMWVTPETMTVPKRSRSLYTAYEVHQVIPVLDRSKTYAQWLCANRWTQAYLPNFPAKKIDSLHRSSATLPPILWHGINYLLFVVQTWYMTPHVTTEQVALDQALFHPRNTENEVFSGLLATLRTWKKEVLSVESA